MLFSNSIFRTLACGLLMTVPQFQAAVVLGQESSTTRSAFLTAIVSDPSGAVIPNAEVSFEGEKKLVTKTAQDGSIHVSLPYGRYVVTINSPGFERTKISDLRIDNDKPPVLSVVLQVSRKTGEYFGYGMPTITSDVPNVIEADRVPDAATALHIAEPALIKAYGKRQIEYERPLKAVLENGIWTVYGTLCCPDRKGRRTCEVGKCLGGVAVMKLRQRDGKILSVSHPK